MALLWEQVVVETDDPAVLGHWWAKALEWVIVDQDTEVVEIRPTVDALPGILFLASPAPKQAKNRLHLDFRPDDHDAEVARLLSHTRSESMSARATTFRGRCWRPGRK